MAHVALIGCGVWGENILRDLLDLGQDVTVVETAADRRHDITSRFAVLCVDTLDRLARVDGIIVATPASTHVRVVERVVGLNVPIFVEKPLTTNADEARALARLDTAQIHVMHVWHYHPGVAKLADIARSGMLGAPTLLRTTRQNWTSPRQDVDSVWTLVPHDLSIAQAILGHIPAPLFATCERLSGRATGMLAVLGDCAPQVIIDTSNRFRDKRREIRLHCEQGVAVLESDAADHILIDREDRGSSPASADGQTIGFTPAPPLRSELQAFIAFLEGGPPPPTSVHQGVEVVETIAALRKLAGLPD